MWSDNIAERDYLGFDVHANLIKGFGIKRVCLSGVYTWVQFGIMTGTYIELIRKTYKLHS